jgi:hypothetical protein
MHDPWALTTRNLAESMVPLNESTLLNPYCSGLLRLPVIVCELCAQNSPNKITPGPARCGELRRSGVPTHVMGNAATMQYACKIDRSVKAVSHIKFAINTTVQGLQR